MLDELSALHNSGTWELVPLLSGKSVVGCRWIFAIKVEPNSTIDCLKARLMAKGYTQIFGLDYGEDGFCSFIYCHGGSSKVASLSIGR